MAAPLGLTKHELLHLSGRCLRQRQNVIASGHLKWGRRWRQKSMISSSLVAAASLRVTNAFGRSPHRSSGIATTAHSSTAGWALIACSTSIDEMFSPPEMITSLLRSRSSIAPSGCQTAISPEWNQPPAKPPPSLPGRRSSRPSRCCRASRPRPSWRRRAGRRASRRRRRGPRRRSCTHVLGAPSSRARSSAREIVPPVLPARRPCADRMSP